MGSSTSSDHEGGGRPEASYIQELATQASYLDDGSFRYQPIGMKIMQNNMCFEEVDGNVTPSRVGLGAKSELFKLDLNNVSDMDKAQHRLSSSSHLTGW